MGYIGYVGEDLTAETWLRETMKIRTYEGSAVDCEHAHED